MLTKNGYLWLRTEPASAYSHQLESEGYTVIRDVLSTGEITSLRKAASAVYDTHNPDMRNTHLPPEEQADFRYEMFNRDCEIQAVIGHRAILDVIEPLLGEDCHVIANTCWRNPPREKNRQGGGGWHVDAGPHIPHDPAVRWDERIPYPVFAIGTHIYLEDCPLACGPTAVIPGSHKCGTPPPSDQRDSDTLTCYDKSPVALTAKAGDVAMFVSDVWHRRMPTEADDTGRFFIQVHYARRDIAQRVLPTAAVNHLSEAALARAETPRQKTLIGLHPRGFYDG